MEHQASSAADGSARATTDARLERRSRRPSLQHRLPDLKRMIILQPITADLHHGHTRPQMLRTTQPGRPLTTDGAGENTTGGATDGATVAATVTGGTEQSRKQLNIRLCLGKFSGAQRGGRSCGEPGSQGAEDRRVACWWTP